jgi:hypothetical protein
MFRYRVNGANPTNGHVLTTDGNGSYMASIAIVSGCTTSTTNYITKCGTANQIQNSIVFENVSIPANLAACPMAQAGLCKGWRKSASL